MAYLVFMPDFADEVLGRGPSAYGVLLSAGGVGSLLTSLWLSSQNEVGRNGLRDVIGGAIVFGLSVAAFGLTSRLIGPYPLALVLMFTSGLFMSMYMVPVMTSLRILVPDRLRGRVMGFHGMTWRILPLGGMQAGAMATVVGVPVAIAIGGLVVSAFALGPVAINRQVRGMGAMLLRVQNSPEPKGPTGQPSPSSGDG